MQTFRITGYTPLTLYSPSLLIGAKRAGVRIATALARIEIYRFIGNHLNVWNGAARRRRIQPPPREDRRRRRHFYEVTAKVSPGKAVTLCKWERELKRVYICFTAAVNGSFFSWHFVGERVKERDVLAAAETEAVVEWVSHYWNYRQFEARKSKFAISLSLRRRSGGVCAFAAPIILHTPSLIYPWGKRECLCRRILFVVPSQRAFSGSSELPNFL